MPTKEYVVTVYKRDWLESLYSHMISLGCKLVLKRPDSRNTHYLLTEKQANNLRQNPNIWAVEAVDSFKVRRLELEKEPTVVGGDFWKKGNPVGGVSPGYNQWGLLHCGGDASQRRQNDEWGDPRPTEVVNDNFLLYDQGKNVDVVIVDDPVSFDNEEWYSSTTGQTRFVQYQWFNELNSLVSTMMMMSNITNRINRISRWCISCFISWQPCNWYCMWSVLWLGKRSEHLQYSTYRYLAIRTKNSVIVSVGLLKSFP